MKPCSEFVLRSVFFFFIFFLFIFFILRLSLPRCNAPLAFTTLLRLRPTTNLSFSLSRTGGLSTLLPPSMSPIRARSGLTVSPRPSGRSANPCGTRSLWLRRGPVAAADVLHIHTLTEEGVHGFPAGGCWRLSCQRAQQQHARNCSDAAWQKKNKKTTVSRLPS